MFASMDYPYLQIQVTVRSFTLPFDHGRQVLVEQEQIDGGYIHGRQT